jgi:hypothetical protein
MENLNEDILEEWNEDKLVRLIFLHKINSICINEFFKNIINVETRDGRVLDFTFENEKSALEGLKLFRKKLKVKSGK